MTLIARLTKLLILALFIITSQVILISNAYADEMGSVSAQVTQQSVPNYTLAYPGMLPDNPLYVLKTLRDKVALFLINDPVKKIDFYLLRADKGFGAASMLIDKNEGELAVKTALKAENNMTELVTQIISLPQKPDMGLFGTLLAASNTHQKLLQKMISRASGENQKTLKQVLSFAKSNTDTIQRLSKRNASQWQYSSSQ